MNLADKLIRRLEDHVDTLAEYRQLDDRRRARICELERKLGDAERERDLARAEIMTCRVSDDSLRKERDHWKQARQQAIEAGELMRAEVETLRDENRTLRNDFVSLQWNVESIKRMAGGISTRDADGCIVAVGQIQKYFDAAEYPLCNLQQKGGE